MRLSSKPTILVIVGITGDLCRRYILPALTQLAAHSALPEQFRIIGITRRHVTTEELSTQLPEGTHEYILNNLEMYTMDLEKLDDYKQLQQHLEEAKQAWGPEAHAIFYLSVPPQVSQPIITRLGESGIASSIELMLEKPFGTDLASARELMKHIGQYFEEKQVYRVDHYLAKEIAQNLLVLREYNALFKHTWSNEFIERIDIIASEKISIEGRAKFYEQTGALRDFQSHLLQLAALLLAKNAGPNEKRHISERRLHALQYLHLPEGEPVTAYAKRGQYQGYRSEVMNPYSTVETFMDITFVSDDPIWQGVPIRLVTGKSLDDRFTEIIVTYKKDREYQASRLRITLQPQMSISLDLWIKAPGYEDRHEQQPLAMMYNDHYDFIPQAYERVLFDAINLNRDLFLSSAEVIESWRIVQPLQQAWAATSDDLLFYLPGSRYDTIGT